MSSLERPPNPNVRPILWLKELVDDAIDSSEFFLPLKPGGSVNLGPALFAYSPRIASIAPLDLKLLWVVSGKGLLLPGV
jgi:hypothetical protein